MAVGVEVEVGVVVGVVVGVEVVVVVGVVVVVEVVVGVEVVVVVEVVVGVGVVVVVGVGVGVEVVVGVVVGSMTWQRPRRGIKRMADCHPDKRRHGVRPQNREYALCAKCYNREYQLDHRTIANMRRREIYAQNRQAIVDSRCTGLEEEKAAVVAEILDDLGKVGIPSAEWVQQEAGRLVEDDDE